MVGSAKRSQKKRKLRAEAAPAIDRAPSAVVDRDDGCDLQVHDSHQQVGRFEGYESAQTERDAVGDEALAPGETLQEALQEIGVDEWIDAETGQPAEGESPRHLQEE